MTQKPKPNSGGQLDALAGKFGELLSSKTPGNAAEVISGIAGELEGLKGNVEQSIDKLGIKEIDEIFGKFNEGPLAFIAALPLLFERLGKIFDSLDDINLDSLTSLSLQAPGAPNALQNFDELGKFRPEEVSFKPERGKPVVAELKEKSPNLYAMIDYASRAIGVPFGLIAATIQHESIWGTATAGDGGTSRGLGHMKKSTYELAVSQEWYRDAMQLQPGQEPPSWAENALSDVCAIASLFRYYKENFKGPGGEPIDLTNLSKRDMVFFRAFYHMPAVAGKRTERYIRGDYDRDAKRDEDKDSWLINRYARFADQVLKYDEQYAQNA